uniref:Orf2 n=1 Tax=Papaya mosaic potexvirus TaxID=12181 RepID=A0A3G8FWL7_PMV|nr:orf2 [Papaya mosaic virus]
MNHFINCLVSEGFSRTKEPLTDTLVVHAVAGSGKSTLIRNFLREHPNTFACTHSKPDAPNLEGTFIHKFRSPTQDHFNILDEYCKEPIVGKWDVLIADPLQYSTPALKPHYIKSSSHRLCRRTCALITEVGVPIQSSRAEEGVVEEADLFSSPLLGKIIALDKAAGDLLRAHGVQPLCPIETIGLEFPVVTVVSTEPIRQLELKHQVYIALSRHKERLHVLAPGAPDPPN